MRVAILFSGYIRSFEEVYKSIKDNLINENIDCIFDIYLHYSNEFSKKYLNDDCCIKKIKSLMNFKSVILQDDMNFSKDTKINNILNQNYKLYILNKHKNDISEIENKTYDYTIKLRPDVYLESKINLSNLEKNIIYIPISSKIDKTKLTNINDPFLCDIIAYGDSNIMNRYFDFFKYNNDLMNHYGLVNETLLWYYLKNNMINYQEIDIQFTVVLSKCNTIAITGDSGSGKSTLSNIIKKMFDSSLLLECDRYHKWERGNENWKKYTHLNPDANYITKMNEDVFDLKLGNKVFQVDYNHENGKFTDQECIESKENIIVCGLHSTYIKDNLINISIYLDTQQDLCTFWKIKRDMKKRGYTKEKVYENIIKRRDDFEKFILPQKENSNIIICYYSNYKFNIDTYNENEKIDYFLKVGIHSNIINNFLINNIKYEKIEKCNDHMFFYFNHSDVKKIIITILNNI